MKLQYHGLAELVSRLRETISPPQYPRKTGRLPSLGAQKGRRTPDLYPPRFSMWV